MVNFSPKAPQILFGARKPILTQNTSKVQPLLTQLASNADKVTDWSWEARLDGTRILTTLSGKLDGKEFAVGRDVTRNTFSRGKEGAKKEFPIFDNKVSAEGVENDQPVSVLKKTFDGLFAKLARVAQPKIEKDFGLGKGLDLSNTLADLAAKTARGELKWTDTSEAPTDLTSAITTVLNQEASLVATDKDGTQYGIKQEAVLLGLGGSASFLMVAKPDKPVQTISIGGGREDGALELLTNALQSFAQEKEADAKIAEAQAQIAELGAFKADLPQQRAALAAEADTFKQG